MPPGALTGTPEEMVCPGGELAFVRRMVEESAALRGAVHWYSTMLGKKATLKEVRKELHGLGVTALRTTELAQVGRGRDYREGVGGAAPCGKMAMLKEVREGATWQGGDGTEDDTAGTGGGRG